MTLLLPDFHCYISMLIKTYKPAKNEQNVNKLLYCLQIVNILAKQWQYYFDMIITIKVSLPPCQALLLTKKGLFFLPLYSVFLLIKTRGVCSLSFP